MGVSGLCSLQWGRHSHCKDLNLHIWSEMTGRVRANNNTLHMKSGKEEDGEKGGGGGVRNACEEE